MLTSFRGSKRSIASGRQRFLAIIFYGDATAKSTTKKRKGNATLSDRKKMRKLKSNKRKRVAVKPLSSSILPCTNNKTKRLNSKIQSSPSYLFGGLHSLVDVSHNLFFLPCIFQFLFVVCVVYSPNSFFIVLVVTFSPPFLNKASYKTSQFFVFRPKGWNPQNLLMTDYDRNHIDLLNERGH